jgi:predicted translin family RNA/ssDNA-binding protein
MQRKDDHKAKGELEKLAEDLGELQSNLENFKEAVTAVER